MQSFEFYMDLTSGTRNNVGLFKALNAPVFSLHRSPQDMHTLPVPDSHMILGVFNDSAPYNFHKLFQHTSGLLSCCCGLIQW